MKFMSKLVVVAAVLWASSVDSYTTPETDPTTSCMETYAVPEELIYGMYTLQKLNRTTPEDTHNIGCVEKCVLQKTGDLANGDTIIEAFVKKARTSFEESNRIMRNNLDHQVKNIHKCGDMLEDSDIDECLYTYKFKRCLDDNDVYLF